MDEVLRNRNFEKEWIFTATRSSGPGGQNVNKVNTRIELRFNILSSVLLTGEEKAVLMGKLSGKINSNGELIIVSQSERTQLKNREKTTEKFFRLLEIAFHQPKERKHTRPTQASVIKRLEWKHKQSEKKEGRKNPDL
jgi:ribosome-associated protein